MNERIRQCILSLMDQTPGMKATEMSVVIAASMEFDFKPEEFLDTTEEMVNKGELIEVEYILQSMDHRVKSFYLPAGTTVRVRGDVPTK